MPWRPALPASSARGQGSLLAIRLTFRQVALQLSRPRNYIEARIATLMWGIRLKDSAGELDEEDVQQLNSLLDIPQGG